MLSLGIWGLSQLKHLIPMYCGQPNGLPSSANFLSRDENAVYSNFFYFWGQTDGHDRQSDIPRQKLPIIQLQRKRNGDQHVKLPLLMIPLMLLCLWQIVLLLLRRTIDNYRAMHFSAFARGLAIACRLSVCPSVCNVGDLWSHRLEILETNYMGN